MCRAMKTRRSIFSASLAIFFMLGGIVRAQEDRALNILVTDTQGRPIPNVHLALKGGNSTSELSDRLGRVRLRLTPAIKPGSEVELYIEAVS